MFNNMMKTFDFFNLIIKRFNVVNYTSPLGRWSINKCENKTAVTNYYNNIDHCGSCFYNKEEVDEMVKTYNKLKEKE